jgi:hypothetical protein
MIPRYQRILFWTLLLASVAMAVVLIRFRELAADRIAGRAESADTAELADTVAAPAETVTLLEANDLEGGVAPVTRHLPLPKETGARARVLLRGLFVDYAAPDSKHPIPPSRDSEGGVDDVFFMTARPGDKSGTQGQTAIVNLTGAFADNHPSGIEVESLTLLSIIGTLHENFPNVQQVRFLVDGQPRDTLAGHADLTRVYLANAGETHP